MLSKTDLSGASLYRANMEYADLRDTKLNGAGNYQTRFVNADDYRAQEFPNGTSTTINTYYLRIHKS